MSQLLKEPNGTWRRVPAAPDQARAERKARLQALVESEEWQDLVVPGLKAQRKRLVESLTCNAQLTEREVREHQARCGLLQSLIARPVMYLLEEDKKGDE